MENSEENYKLIKLKQTENKTIIHLSESRFDVELKSNG